MSEARLSNVLGYLSRLKLRHRWNLRGSKYIKRCGIWILQLLLCLRLALIPHINLIRHTMSCYVLVLTISAHLATVTTHHASWCCHLVLIHNYLLRGIYHGDIGSLTSYRIIMSRVLLWFCKILVWEVWHALCFILYLINVFSRLEICLLTMALYGITLWLWRCLRYRSMEGWKINCSEKTFILCTGYLLLGLWLWLNSFWGGIIWKKVKCVN